MLVARNVGVGDVDVDGWGVEVGDVGAAGDAGGAEQGSVIAAGVGPAGGVGQQYFWTTSNWSP